jgi:hypothetical protein
MLTIVNQASKLDRPLLITVFCVSEFVAYLVIVTLLIFLSTTRVDVNTVTALFIPVRFMGVAGLWLMRKWAVYTYTVVILVHQVNWLLSNRWTLGTLIVDGLILLILYRNLSKMS